MEAKTHQTIYTVPLHVGQNIEVPEGSIVAYYPVDRKDPYPDSPAVQVIRTNGQRFRLVEDDDGHWYVIPVDREEDFNSWVDDTVNDWYSQFDFDEFRLSGSPSNLTFIDPITEDGFL